MKLDFLGADEGQSLILIAGAFAMLLGAVVLGVDRGYEFVQRRAMTNAAQAGALAAGRTVAEAVTWTVNGAAFPGSTGEDFYKQACTYVLKNLGSPVEPSTYWLTVEFLRMQMSGTTAIEAEASPYPYTFSGTGFTRTSTDCSVTSGSTYFSALASGYFLDVRVTAGISYPAIFAGVIGKKTLAVSSTARSRVSGSTSISGIGADTPWAMVRHYEPTDFAGGTCTGTCNPDTTERSCFWSSANNGKCGGGNVRGDESTFGQFNGLIDYSRYSAFNNATPKPQLIADWDHSGSAQATAPSTTKPDLTSNNGCQPYGGRFDTAGGLNSSGENNCSIPNWGYYLFRGTLSLTCNWGVATPAPTPAPPTPTPCANATSIPSQSPNPLGTRAICSSPSPAPVLSVPSCPNYTIGDWVEVSTGGSLSQTLGDPLCAAINTYGTKNDYYSTTVPTPPGAGGKCPTPPCANGDTKCDPLYQSGTYGKSLVVMVYLWDCGESWDTSAKKWTQYSNYSDCANTQHFPNNKAPDRVHLFTVAPFTFYYGLVGSNWVQGYWGGAFGVSIFCTGSCGLNGFSNTTYLVADQ